MVHVAGGAIEAADSYRCVRRIQHFHHCRAQIRQQHHAIFATPDLAISSCQHTKDRPFPTTQPHTATHTAAP